MNKLILSAILIGSIGTVYAHDVGTAVWNVTTFAGSSAGVTSQHHARLINNTNVAQTYYFYARLCVDGMGCTEPVQLRPTVAPHAEKTIRKTLYLERVYKQRGIYNILATTEVIGDGGEKREMNATLTVR